MIQSLNDLISNRDDNAIALKDYNIELNYGKLKKTVFDLSKLLQRKYNSRRYRVLFAEAPSILLSIAYLSVVSSGGLAFFSNPVDSNILDIAKKYEIDVVVTENDNLNGFVSILDFINMNFTPNYTYKKINDFNACTAFFTSGTSGEAKCVLLSEKNLCENVIAGCSMLEYSPSDIHLNILPFYHAYGITCSLLAPLYSGGTLCFGESVATFFRDLNIFKPTFIQTVPMVLQTILAYSQNHKMSIYKILSGGANTPAELINAFRKIGIQVYSCYGMTECSPCISCNDGNISKDSSVGKLLSCNQIKFLDEEIFLCGTNIMLGYFGEEKQGDWFQTGDCGYMDKDGYLYLTGRKNGCVKLQNGEKLFPEQIENIANMFSGVVESRATLNYSSFILEIFVQENTVDLYSLENFIYKNLSVSIKLDKIIIVPHAFPRTSTMKIRRK